MATTQVAKDSATSEIGIELVSLDFQANPVTDVGIPPGGSIKVMFKLPDRYSLYCGNKGQYTVHVLQSQQLRPSVQVEVQECLKVGKLIALKVRNLDDRLYRSVSMGDTLKVCVRNKVAAAKSNIYVLGQSIAEKLVKTLKRLTFLGNFEVAHLSTTHEYRSKLQLLQEKDVVVVVASESEVLHQYIKKYTGEVHPSNVPSHSHQKYCFTSWFPLLDDLRNCKAQSFVLTHADTNFEMAKNFPEFVIARKWAQTFLKSFFNEVASVVKPPQLLKALEMFNVPVKVY